MTTRMRLALSVGLVWLMTTATGLGQTRDTLAGLQADMTPAEVQQLFDAFELVRAQEMLNLSDEQYPQFVVKLKALQEIRRETQQQRAMLLRELQRMANQPNVDETQLADRLDALKAHDRETVQARVQARDEIDALLTVRQQVRYRMFEQAIERRRIELLMRAQRGRSDRQR